MTWLRRLSSRLTRGEEAGAWALVGHLVLCLAALLAVLEGAPYSLVVLLAPPVLLASTYFRKRVYLGFGLLAGACALVAILARAPDRGEALAAFYGLALSVALTSELLFRLSEASRKAQQQLQDRAGLLDSLYATTLGVLTGAQAGVLLEVILRRACQLLRTPHGNMFLVEGDRLRCRFALGATRWMQEEALQVAPGEGIAGQVWEQRRPLVVADYPRWEGRLRDRRSDFIHHAVGIPLFSRGQVMGVIVVVREDPGHPFTADEVDVAGRFGALASLVLEHAALYEGAQRELEGRRRAEAELARQHELLQLLHTTVEELLKSRDFETLLATVTHRACGLLRCRHGNLYLRDGEVMRCRVGAGAAAWAEIAEVRLRKGEGMVGRVWESGEILVVEDYARWPNRLPYPEVIRLGPALAIPLYEGQEITGGLFLARDRSEPPFTREEVEVAARFGQVTSLILHNASLYRAAREQLRLRTETEQALRARQALLEALHQTLHELLVGPLDSQAILQALVGRACVLLDSPHGILYVKEGDRLRCISGLGAMAWAAEQGLTLAKGEGMTGQVWQTGEPLVVEDYASWPARLPSPGFDRLGPAVTVPLFAAGEFVGAFSVARDRGARLFSGEELDAVVRFGRLASLVLNNASLYERLQASTRALAEQKAFYESILDNVESEIAVFDTQLRYVYVNPRAVRDPELRRWIIGRDDHEYCLRKGRDLSLAIRRQESLRRALRERQVVEHEEVLRTPWGEDRYYLRRVCPVVDGEGQVVRLIGYGLDITDRKRAELRLAHLALHDALTGLPNRTLFLDRLSHALERARRTGGGVAVLFVDLDCFKGVNDALGHEAGDELLRQVAARLRSCLRSSDTLARLAGDEFTILLEELVSVGDARGTAERVLATFRKPFLIAGRSVSITASVGLAFSGPQQASAEDLLRRSDAAMYRAKSQGRDRVCVEDNPPPVVLDHGPVAD